MGFGSDDVARHVVSFRLTDQEMREYEAVAKRALAALGAAPGRLPRRRITRKEVFMWGLYELQAYFVKLDQDKGRSR